MCHFNLAETDSERDWSYLSEGGASILLAYVGKQHSVCSGKVLRIRKTFAPHLPGSRNPETPDTFENPQDDQDPSVVFQKLVISQLLPEHYLPDVQSVNVTSEWLCKLAVVVEPFRPDVRKRQRQSIDTSRRVAALATNLVESGLAVEIKVDRAFLNFISVVLIANLTPLSQNGGSFQPQHYSPLKLFRLKQDIAGSACTVTTSI